MSINYSGEFGANGWGAYTPDENDFDDESCTGCFELLDECACTAIPEDSERQVGFDEPQF